MAYLFTAGKFQAIGSTGLALPGALLYTYAAGGLTPLATYTNQGGLSSNANPVVCDAAGQANVWLGTAAYRFILKTAADVTVWDIDNVRDPMGALSGTATADGDALVYYKRTFSGAIASTLHAWHEVQPINLKTDCGAVGDGVTNDTTAIQLWLDRCASLQRPGYAPAGTYLCTGVTKTMAGNRITQDLILYGDGRNASIIKQSGTPTEVIKFASSTPTTGGAAAQIVMRDMAIVGVGKTCFGLTLHSVNDILLENVRIEGFTENLYLLSSLMITARNCQFANGNNGVKTERSGTSSYCNALAFIDCSFMGNSSHAGDFGAANNVSIVRPVVETCGTAGDDTTGPWYIQDTCDDETGYTAFAFEDGRYEQNQGRGLQAEAMSSGLDIDIRGGSTLTHATGGNDIHIAGARRVSIEGYRAVSASSVWNITADQLFLANTKVGTLTDSGVTYATYINAEANGATYIDGRTDSYTGTLTGCTTSPTRTVNLKRQGKRVIGRLDAALSATSNTTAATVTGTMPTPFRPSANRQPVALCIDNGVTKASAMTVGTDGVLTLSNAGAAFTSSGTKGLDLGEFSYEL